MKNFSKTSIICLKSGSSMRQARGLMDERRIRHLPIVSADDCVVAMLSRTDLTDVAKFADLPADLFASSPVQTVKVDTPIWSVALLMIEKKIHSVILTDGEQNAVGIISADDLLFQLAQILKEKDKSGFGGWNALNTLSTAGEFFRKLSDIGI